MPRIVILALGCIVSTGAAAVASPAPDELVVSAWNSDSAGRYDAATGAFLGLLDPRAGMDGVLGVARGPEGHLYVCSELDQRIVRFAWPSGVYIDDFVAGGPELDGPAGVLFVPDLTDDGAADLLVASFDSDAILLHDGVTGAFVRTFVASGSGGLNGPDAGMALGADGDLYVPSYWTSRIVRYDGRTGALVEVFVFGGTGGLSRPRTIVFRPQDGNMVVASEGSDAVLVFDARNGDALGALVTGFPDPSGLAFAPDGSLLVASGAQDSVHRVDGMTGVLIEVLVEPGAGGVDAPTFLHLLVTGDVTGDGAVGVDDLLALLAAWGPCDPLPAGCPADMDGSGAVDVGDLLLVLGAWSS